MKVAVIGSRIDKDSVQRSKAIIDITSKHGNKVDSSMMKRTLEQEMQELEKTYKANLRTIKDSDVLIAETTQYSAGIGYIIATAMYERKPVLALHNKKSSNVPSIMLKGAKSKMLDFVEYDDGNLDSIIKTYLDKIKSELDTKFILIISPNIDKYLKWASDEYRLHKAQIVRDAVEEKMKKDKEYKAYLNQVE